jgi:hypothetical protein
MAYTDLRDFEPEYKTTTDRGLTVQIEKLGGGTVGTSYVDEDWRYIVTGADGTELGRGQDLHIRSAATHEQAAEAAAEYFERD